MDGFGVLNVDEWLGVVEAIGQVDAVEYPSSSGVYSLGLIK